MLMDFNLCMLFLMISSIALKNARCYLKPKDDMSTDELPHWFSEMDWYKEMRQDISLNANIVFC